MSKLLNCLVIDDEPPAIRLLAKYIDNVHFLSLKGRYTNPLEALKHLEKDTIDLVFLDIQMPEITGVQLAKIITNKTKIIFTTAYPQFAIDSYDVAAVDYLLKPIEFERFYKAVLKVEQQYKTTGVVNSSNTNDFFFLKTDGKNKFAKVFLKAVLYVESLKNYVCVQQKDSQVITYNTLKNIKQNLPVEQFIQIHKSYIVAIAHIEKIDNDSIWIQNKELPIGNTYKKSFFEVISNNQL